MNIAAKTKPDKNTEFCPLLKGPTWWPSRQFLAASCSTNLMQTLWGQYATNPPIFRIILLPTCVLSLAYILSWSTWVIKIILTYLLYFSSHLADNALFFICYSCNHAQYVSYDIRFWKVLFGITLQSLGQKNLGNMPTILNFWVACMFQVLPLIITICYL